MDFSSIILETNRLRLFSANKSYANEIYHGYKYPVTRYMNFPPPKNIQDLEARLIQRVIEMRKGELVYLILVIKETDKFIGVFAIEDLALNTPEIGGWLKSEFHGKGYGKEALKALKKWANDNIHFKYLKWPCAEKNVASCKLAESLGGEIKKTYVKKNLTGYTGNYREYHIPRE